MSQIRSQTSEVRSRKRLANGARVCDSQQLSQSMVPGLELERRERFVPLRTGMSALRGLACVLILAGAMSVRAQIGGMVNQSENANTREQLNQTAESQMNGSNSVPQLYEGETSDVGPQSVVEPRVRHTLFQAKVDEQLLYTDNVFLTDQNKINSGVLISTAQFALAPTPYRLGSGMLAPRVGYKAQWFDYLANDERVARIGNEFVPQYKELNDFDFNSQSVFADALWTRGHVSLGGGLEATRMFNTAHYDPFYDELAPYWSARYVVPVCEKSALSVEYLGDYRFTSQGRNFFTGIIKSDQNDRTDHGLLLSWTQVLCKHAVFQPFYEFKYTRFTEEPPTFNPLTGQRVDNTRNDYLNTVGAGLYWFVCPNCTLRGFVNYNILTSSMEQAEYREFDGGAGIDLSIKF